MEKKGRKGKRDVRNKKRKKTWNGIRKYSWEKKMQKMRDEK